MIKGPKEEVGCKVYPGLHGVIPTVNAPDFHEHHLIGRRCHEQPFETGVESFFICRRQGWRLVDILATVVRGIEACELEVGSAFEAFRNYRMTVRAETDAWTVWKITHVLAVHGPVDLVFLLLIPYSKVFFLRPL